MDICDVCEKPASQVCGNCLDAVYCSKECQLKDHPDHCQDCVHPSQMDRDELMAEIKMHVDHADENHDANHVKIGVQLLQGSVGGSVDQSPVLWLLEHLNAGIRRRFNRQRVRHQRRKTRRGIRRTHREGRQANRGSRQAKALGREKGRLGRAKQRTNAAKGREDANTYTNLQQ